MIIPVGYASVSVPLTHPSINRQAFITFGVQNAGTFADPNVVAQAVQDAIVGTIQNRFDTELLIGPTEAQVNVSAGPLPGIATDTTNGTSVADTPPPNVAILCRKHTLTPGRTGRGRFYLPWACDQTGISQGGQLEAAVVTATQDRLTEFLAALDENQVPMVVLHNGSGAPSEVTSFSVDTLVATQRRRLGR
jgi:hypothetical protein